MSPGANPKFRLTAEIQIIEVKIESFIEADIVREQGLAGASQEQSVQQLDLLIGRAVVTDILWRPVAAHAPRCR